MIRQFEELSLNAWPAAATLFYDGWVLRFTGGYTRRANSINPLYPSTLGMEEKIHACEQVYRAEHLPVIFKMTPATEPGLDARLADLGYQYEAVTSVHVLDLSDWNDPLTGLSVLSTELTDPWLADFSRMSGIQGSSRALHRQILGAIHPPACYASARAAGQPAACGLGVLDSGCIGLYDIITDAAFRRQGCGERIVRDLLTWGKQNGARVAYLQVMLNNAPALRLYEKVGFREAYRYWYRVKN